MEDDPLDPVWKALANPFRRKMLDLLRDEAMTTGELTSAFPELSRFSVMQHLDVLEGANLIVARRVGRKRYNHLNAVPIRQVYERWVSGFEGHWAGALVALKREMEQREASGGPAAPGKKATAGGSKTSGPGKRHSGSGRGRKR